MKIAHIVNPLVVTNPASDLNFAQPITLLSMQRAKACVNKIPELDVTQYAAFYEEDRLEVPADFVRTPVLERSVLDFVKPDTRIGLRKLPLLRDILDRLYAAASDADYLIYSNIDIGLWPDFYLNVYRKINQGKHAFLIGRQTLSMDYTSPEDLDKILAQKGIPHYGYSCFVFPRSHYEHYILGDTCIGLQPIGVTLAVNMSQHAASFERLFQTRMTFHLGDDKLWQKTLLDTCHLHNEHILDWVMQQLSQTELTSKTKVIFNDYLPWRVNYVIDHSSNQLSRLIYRVLRKVGLGAWVAARYDKLK